jgi:hypothetical protein
MKTVKLEEKVRQKDPELKQAVEELARGQVGLAVAGLERQGRIHEVKGHEERIAAIAKEYARSPERTLVVSPDNHSRGKINQAIHAELRAKGVVASDEHPTHVTAAVAQHIAHVVPLAGDRDQKGRIRPRQQRRCSQ